MTTPTLVAALLAAGVTLKAHTGPLGMALGSLGTVPEHLRPALFAHRDAVLAYVAAHGQEKRYGGSLAYVVEPAGNAPVAHPAGRAADFEQATMDAAADERSTR